MQTEKVNNLPLYMKVTRKKTNGIVYTPEWVVNLILDDIDYKNNIYDKKIIDPSCGEGNFLIIVVERFLDDCIKNNLSSDKIREALQNNIFGFDIDKNAIYKCKTNLNNIIKKYGIDKVEWNILQIDSLDKNKVKQYFNYFDYVVGNPPYIRIQHLGKERRERIQQDWSFCRNGSTDIYIAFFELGLNLLKETGKLGYITPNTYFKTETAKTLRYYIMEEKIIKKIVDFNYHQVFNDATTYSAITILDKSWRQNKFYYFNGYKESVKYVDEIELTSIDYNKWTLASNNVLKRIKEIETRGMPLGKIAQIHVGITTLADDFYIFKDPIIEDDKAIIKLKDGRVFTIEKDILKRIVKVSVLKSPNEEQNRWIIFPYKKVNGKHTIIPEEELKKLYPNTYKYFLAIKDRLLLRDKGKKNPVAWYAFGRSQGLDTTWGKKILVPPLSLKPNFIVWEKEEYTFYAGYCIKFDGDLHWLAKQLNSEDMEFYIKYV
ncbi:MAG: HsdM family class I SAM-dependent methyltransferase, partial [Candidatus Hydrogenedens sp.]